MDLDELDKQITKMDRIQELRQIELNKLRAYYWVLNRFNIKADEIDKVHYSPGKDVSKVFMKNRKNDGDCHIVRGHVHNILKGLDTSYDEEKG